MAFLVSIRKKLTARISIWLFCFFGILLPSTTFASIVINEIAWMGTTEGWQNEWIELHNFSGQEIDITDWKIENGGAKNETLVIPAGKIAANGYFLICRQEIGGCDTIESKMSLHNEYNKNGSLVLKDSSDNVVDTTPPATTVIWPGGDNKTKQTMERKNPLLAGDLPDNWQTSQAPGGTPKQINTQLTTSPVIPSDSEEPRPSETPEQQDAGDSSAAPPLQNDNKPPASITDALPEIQPSLPQPIKYPSNVFINEILPSPEGADAEQEWIEIYNANNFEVTLSGWQIRDKVGQDRTYTCPTNTKVAPYGFLLVHRTESKITLQNSGDALELLNPEAEIVHAITYPKAPQGQSYGRTEGGWAWSTTPTPEKENIITQPQALQSKTEQSSIKTPKKETTVLTATSTESNLLATVGRGLPKKSSKVLTFLLASAIAIASAIIVLFIKRKMPTEDV